ncbi:MAG: carboxypeptidase-like regulatory domain-containing protein, partial [Rikenellaceae bacterium]|nr:carboxypeptidase-like regulatory domain-containing protein [Rikenellaceae bacterium]
MVFVFLCLPAGAQARKHTVSGRVTDAATGEVLVGATVWARDTRLAATTDAYGLYALTVAPGSYILEISYIGYAKRDTTLSLRADGMLNFALEPSLSRIEQVVVTTSQAPGGLTSPQMGVIGITASTIKTV